MTVKKLAGMSVPDYLIRQVAAQDARVPAGGLTSYYTEQGEAPGGVFPKKWRHGFHAASSLMCLYPSSYSCGVK